MKQCGNMLIPLSVPGIPGVFLQVLQGSGRYHSRRHVPHPGGRSGSPHRDTYHLACLPALRAILFSIPVQPDLGEHCLHVTLGRLGCLILAVC